MVFQIFETFFCYHTPIDATLEISPHYDTLCTFSQLYYRRDTPANNKMDPDVQGTQPAAVNKGVKVFWWKELDLESQRKGWQCGGTDLHLDSSHESDFRLDSERTYKVCLTVRNIVQKLQMILTVITGYHII